MASINPTTLQCSAEPYTGKKAYLKLTITSISDSDASTNQRYVGWKITIEGTPWSSLKARYASLGGHEIRPLTTTAVNNWSSGQQLDSGNETYTNDAAGNLTLYAYLKQLFYYSYSNDRWNNGTAQAADCNMVCSQLPRYANFTQHYINATGINTFGVHWEADAGCDASQYSLNGGAWTDGASWPNYTIGGLSPGTGYNIRTRIKRSDSQLWTESGYLYVTTASLPSTNTPSNFNLGSSPTPSIGSMSNLSYWYVHTYDGNTLLNDSGAIYSTSKTIDLTNSTLINQMLARHPNENEWNITFKYYCVSNGVTYTLTQRTCKCVIPQGQYTPTFNDNNVSYEVTDQQTLDLTGSNKKVIKGISDITVNISPASPNGSASMVSYNATSGNSIGTTTNTSTPSINLTNVSADSVTVQAVDSRNRTTNVTKNYDTFIDYFAPVITSAAINRIDGVGSNLTVNITGHYCNWTGLATTNIMSQLSIQYKKKTDANYTTITGVNLNIVNDDGDFTITGNITGNKFLAAEEYDLLLTFKDKINNLPLYQSIPTGEAMLWRDMTNKRVGIGKKPTKTLDVAGDTNIDEDLSVSGDVNIAGKTYFGIDGREDYNNAGFTYDDCGNMRHKRSTTSDNFNIDGNSGNHALKIYPETGEAELSNGKVLFNPNTRSHPNGQWDTPSGTCKIFRDGIGWKGGSNPSGNDSGWICFYEGTTNSGDLEIATGDDANEPIFFRQYHGDNISREFKLFAGDGWLFRYNNSAGMGEDGNVYMPWYGGWLSQMYENSIIKNAYNISSMQDADSYIHVTRHSGNAKGINWWDSDIRLKDNIKDTKENGLSVINQIEHKSFTKYKELDKKDIQDEFKIGYIANQLQDIDKQLVFGVEQGDGIEPILNININVLIPYMTKAIQELSLENKDLRNKINELEQKINNLNS